MVAEQQAVPVKGEADFLETMSRAYEHCIFSKSEG